MAEISPGLPCEDSLGNVAHGKPSLIVIGDLHQFKRVFRHSGLYGGLAKLYAVNTSVLVLVETFDYPGLARLDHLDDVIVGKFSDVLMALKCSSCDERLTASDLSKLGGGSPRIYAGELGFQAERFA